MKTLSITLLGIVLCSGCISKRFEVTETTFMVVDSTSLVYEDINKPGTMLYFKDTLYVTRKTIDNGRKGVTSYKVKN
jgi:hypothetical protein